MSARLPVVLTVLALAIGPVLGLASGGWRMHGSFEPDTPEDVLGGRMFPDPPPAEALRDRLYFDAIAHVGHSYLAVGARSSVGVAPNVLPGSRMAPPGSVEVHARLGLWQDCNGDGAVGSLEGAFQEYPALLLANATRCPVGTPHNDGEWVWELLPVQPGGTVSTTLVGHVVLDDEARVWGDWGRPGDAPAVECPIRGLPDPLPRGVYARPGPMVGALDCLLGHHGAGALEAGSDATGLDVAFEDPYHPERDCDHPLNSPYRLWADPYRCEGDGPGRLEMGTGEPVFTTWDCQQPAWLAVGGAAPDEPLVVAPRVSPRLHDPDGSLLEGVNETQGACSSLEVAGVPVGGAGHVVVGIVPLLEGIARVREQDHAPRGPEDGKVRTDFPMVYNDGGTRRDLAGLPLFSQAPTGYGLAPFHSLRGHAWHPAGAVSGPPSHMGALVRSSDLTPAPPVYLTFYARVGGETLVRAMLPTGTEAVYGASNCGLHKSGVHNGWDCNRDHWWDPDRGAPPNRGPTAVRPGDPYHLLDVDCLDGSPHGEVPWREVFTDRAGRASCPRAP